jgi:OOP family OmpA-OmpF porin
MQRLYPDVMQALPEKPRSFTLRFEENGTKLTAESAMMVEDIRQEILKRAVPEVTVIGHTDRVGSEEDNLRLSRARAEAIRDILIAGGVPAQIIQAIGLGELEPEVMTEDGVAEPRNRRVEISVR